MDMKDRVLYLLINLSADQAIHDTPICIHFGGNGAPIGPISIVSLNRVRVPEQNPYKYGDMHVIADPFPFLPSTILFLLLSCLPCVSFRLCTFQAGIYLLLENSMSVDEVQS